MACPFFMPTEKFEGGSWPHPSRLPLGAGWKGRCSAPGFEEAIPDDKQIQNLCNLGYAKYCAWHPAECTWDSVRFGVTSECAERIVLCYVCEKQHRPAAHGVLEYDPRRAQWNIMHTHPGVQRMAECFVESYLMRKSPTTFIK